MGTKGGDNVDADENENSELNDGDEDDYDEGELYGKLMLSVILPQHQIWRKRHQMSESSKNMRR